MTSEISARYNRASVPRGFTYVTTNNLPRIKGHRARSVEPTVHNKDYYLGSRLKWTTMQSNDYGAYEDSYTGFSSLGFRSHPHTTRNERIRVVDDAYRGLNRFDPPRLDPVAKVPTRPRYEPWVPSTWTYNNYPLGTSYYLSRKRALDLNDEIANLYDRDFRNRRYLHNQDTLNDSKYALHKLRSIRTNSVTYVSYNGNLNYYPYLLPSRSGLGRDYVPEVTYQPSTSAFPYTYLRTKPTYFLEPIDWSRFTPRPVDFVPNRYLHVPIRVPRGSRHRRATSVQPAGHYTVDDGRRARSVSRVRSPVRDVGHNIRARALLDKTTPNYYHTHGYQPGMLPAERENPYASRSTSVPRSTTPSRSSREPASSPSSYTPTKRYDTVMPQTSDSGRGRRAEPDTGSRGSGYQPTTDRPSRRTEPTSPSASSGGDGREPYGRTPRRQLVDVPEEETGRAGRDRDRPSDTTGRKPAYENDVLPEAPRKSALKKPSRDETDAPYIGRRHPTAAGEDEDAISPSGDRGKLTPSPTEGLKKPGRADDNDAAPGDRAGGKPTGTGRGGRPADDDEVVAPTGNDAGSRKPSAGGLGGADPHDDEADRAPTRTPPPSAEEDEEYIEPPESFDTHSPFGAAKDRRESKQPHVVDRAHSLLWDPDAEEDNADAPNLGGKRGSSSGKPDAAGDRAKPTGGDKPGVGGKSGAPGADKDAAGPAGKGAAGGAAEAHGAGKPSGAGPAGRRTGKDSGADDNAGATPKSGGANTDLAKRSGDSDKLGTAAGRKEQSSSREYREETREEEYEEVHEKKKQGVDKRATTGDARKALASDRAGAGKQDDDAQTVPTQTAPRGGAQDDDEERRGLEEEEMIVEESAEDTGSRRRSGDYDERAIAKRSRTEQEQATEKKDFTEEYEYEVRRETTAYEITETWEEQIEHAGYEEIVEAAPEGEEGEFVEDEDEQATVEQPEEQTEEPAEEEQAEVQEEPADAPEEVEAAAGEEVEEEEEEAQAEDEEVVPEEEEE